MRSTQNPALLKAFAAELKARRAVRGFNQEELGFASGLNRTFIAKLETGTAFGGHSEVGMSIEELMKKPLQN